MNLLWSALIVVVTAALAVTVMLLVRRNAPEGSRFTDGDRASGVFGVLATGFSVLLGFVVFLAFESYDQSRSGGEAEALVVSQQVETAQFFRAPVAQRLTGELVCYGRSVVHVEWPRAESGVQGDAINPWGVRLFRTFKTIRPQTASEQAAYGKWMDETSDREGARIDRIHGATGVIPTPLWLVLFLISGVVFVFMLFFADSAEGVATQATLMGSVAIVVVSMLLLISFLDSPFQKGIGGVRPVAMQRTLRIVNEALLAVGARVRLPCDARGNPVS
jgi:succinate dehydrogenase/fumarate reductase cytochrome b subunit